MIVQNYLKNYKVAILIKAPGKNYCCSTIDISFKSLLRPKYFISMPCNSIKLVVGHESEGRGEH